MAVSGTNLGRQLENCTVPACVRQGVVHAHCTSNLICMLLHVCNVTICFLPIAADGQHLYIHPINAKCLAKVRYDCEFVCIKVSVILCNNGRNE